MARILGTIASSFIEVTSFESIATVEVGAGGASYVEFTSIPSTYKHLQLRYIARTSYGGSSNIINIHARFNSEAGTNYAQHRINGDGATVAAGGGGNIGSFLMSYSIADGYESGMFGGGVMDILDYADTNKYKTVRTLGGVDTNNTGGEKGIMSFASGLWKNTNAISSIRIACASDLSTGLARYSHFALYGIKGA